jgi:glutaminyl-tRNA synthetase
MKSRNFLQQIIDADLESGRHTKVVTRFPPEPNGYLHIGHAKSILLNFGLAGEYGGICHLRFDDTNPEAEDMEYVEAIQRDAKWLGVDWGENLFFASDYYEKLYGFALELIDKGLAYVCPLNDEETREYRGTVTEPGKPSPGRDRSISENLDLFTRMRAGEFDEGQYTLRAKIDMSAANMKMRDPLMYRIRKTPHYRTGDAWVIYPMYDFAHCLGDAIEGITHSICTLEFENNRELYDWFVNNVSVEAKPRQYEFARLGLNYTVMSKRLLLTLVKEKRVSGWDDPRMPTIAGFRRRGVTPEAIAQFCEDIGVAKANSTVDMAKLESVIRDDLNHKSRRVMAVLDPLKVVVENYPEDQTEDFDCAYWPEDIPKEGTRKVPFSRELFIERDDFMEEAPKKWHRLAPGQEVRLRYAYYITCKEVVKDDDGNIVELRCTYDPESKGGTTADGRRVKGTLHWVSAKHAGEAEVRLYDRLLSVPEIDKKADWHDSLNPDSLKVVKARVESSLMHTTAGAHFQFERTGYFFVDPEDSEDGKPVFNRVVALRDSWAKVAKKSEPAAPSTEKTSHAKPKNAQVVGERKSPILDEEQQAWVERWMAEYDLGKEDAETLAANKGVAKIFEIGVAEHPNPKGVANWVLNDVMREIKERDVDALPFGGSQIAELVKLIDDGAISSKVAKDIFADMAKDGGSPKDIVEKRGLKQVDDLSAVEAFVNQVLEENPDEAARFLAGEKKLQGFLVGQVMKISRGKANPKLVNQVLGKL